MGTKMKISTTNRKTDEQQELERFTVASARLVQRAQKDKSVAQKFLNDIGYYSMMSQTSEGQSRAASVRNSAVRASSARGASVYTSSKVAVVNQKSTKAGAAKAKTAAAKPAKRKAAGKQK